MLVYFTESMTQKHISVDLEHPTPEHCPREKKVICTSSFIHFKVVHRPTGKEVGTLKCFNFQVKVSTFKTQHDNLSHIFDKINIWPYFNHHLRCVTH